MAVANCGIVVPLPFSRHVLCESLSLIHIYINPTVVVALGNFATRLLLDRAEGIRQLRGAVYPYRSGHLVPTYHPAYVLRAGGEALAEMRADLIRAKRLMGRGT